MQEGRGVNYICRNKLTFCGIIKLKQRNKLKEHKRFLRGKTSWAQEEKTNSTTKDFKFYTFTKLKQRNNLKEHKGLFLRGKNFLAQQEKITLTTRDFKLNTFTN